MNQPICITTLIAALACAGGCSPGEGDPVRVVGERSGPARDVPTERPRPLDFSGGGPVTGSSDGGVPDLLKGDLAVSPGHQPTQGGDRETLAAVYISFAEDPEGFVERVERLPAHQRGRLADFLFCAAPKLLAAGQQAERGPVGAPVELKLPAVADELIGFKGSPARMRSMFLRQLAGEFLIVGRAIQSIDRGQRQAVDEVLANQQRNLEMMQAAAGPTEAAKWSARIRRVFPVLFEELLPEC